jgi:hypothetical protein
MTTAHHSARGRCQVQVATKRYIQIVPQPPLHSDLFQLKCDVRTPETTSRRSQSVGGAASDSVMHTKGPRSIKFVITELRYIITRRLGIALLGEQFPCPIHLQLRSLCTGRNSDILEISFTVKHSPIWLYTAKLLFPRFIKRLKAYGIS